MTGFPSVNRLEPFSLFCYELVGVTGLSESEFVALMKRLAFRFGVPAVFFDGRIYSFSPCAGGFDVELDGRVYRFNCCDSLVVDDFSGYSDLISGLAKSCLRFRVGDLDGFRWGSGGVFKLSEERVGDVVLRRFYLPSFRVFDGFLVLFVEVRHRVFHRRNLVDLFGLKDLRNLSGLLVGSRVYYRFTQSVFEVVDVLSVSVSDVVELPGFRDSVLGYLRREYGEEAVRGIDSREPVVLAATGDGKLFAFAPSTLHLVMDFGNIGKFSNWLGGVDAGDILDVVRIGEDMRLKLSRDFVSRVGFIDFGDQRIRFSTDPISVVFGGD